MGKNFDIKPTVKVSKAQKAALAERMLTRQGSQKQGQTGAPGGVPGGMPLGPGGQFQGLPEQMPQPSAMQPDGLGVPQKSYDLSKAKPLASAKVEVPEAHELAAYAAIGAQLWKDMGGMSSLGGHVWDMFRKRAKTHHEEPRDYFISSYIGFQANPEEFAKQRPDEARLLGSIQQEFERSQAPKQPMMPQQSGPVDPKAALLAQLPPRQVVPSPAGPPVEGSGGVV